MKKQNKKSLNLLKGFFFLSALLLLASCSLEVAGAAEPTGGQEPTEKTHTVTFDTGGRSAVASQTITNGDKAKRPVNPKWSGGAFKGWFANVETNIAFDFDAEITNDITAYAAWELNTYTVSFVTNESGAEFTNFMVEHDKTVKRPSPDPTRTDFALGGWFKDAAKNNAFNFDSEKITNNTTVYAGWIKTYTVTFITNTATSATPAFAEQTVRKGSNAVKPSPNPTRTGYAFVNWYSDQAKNTAFNFDSEKITNNTTVYAGWIKTYTVTFITNTATSAAPAFAEQTLRKGSKAVKPSPNPTRTGYAFVNWYSDQAKNTAFNFDTVTITSNTTIYAKWINTYTVSFVTNQLDPTQLWAGQSQTVRKGSNATEPSPAPSWVGRNFKGWFTTAATNVKFDFSAGITEDTTIYAGWELKSYSVTFITNVGNPNFAVQTIKHGSNAVKPSTNPTRSGYLFKGWYTDAAFSSAFNFSAAITANRTLYAKWKVTRDFNTLKAAGNNNSRGIWSDGTTMWVADSALAKSKIYAYRLSDKARDSAKDFNTLNAAGNNNPEGIWSDGTTMWVSDWEDDKIYAYRMSDKARDSAKDFTNLNAAGNNNTTGIWSDGTTMWVADSTLAKSKIYAYRLSDKARDSAKDFTNLAAGNIYPKGIWSDGNTMWVANYVYPDGNNDKLYAYRMNGKTPDSAKDFNTLNAAGNNDPFGIWSDGTTMWVVDVIDDKIYSYSLRTKQRTIYTVTFNANGGSAVSSQTVASGSQATQPSDPTKSGYAFGGWYTDATFNNAFNFSAAITEKRTLYAKWNKLYTVSFNANGGSAVNSQTVEHGSRATKPSDPTKDWYVFGGWYTDQALNNAFSFSAAVTSNTTLYAKWTELAKLLASDRESGDQFGYSVAMDSNTLVVGAYEEDSGGEVNNGAVYVFIRSGGSWNQQAKLTASGKESGDKFGRSVAIDGDTLVVGARDEDSGGKTDNGAVYVFTRSGGSWSEKAKLTASDKASEDNFGTSVAVAGDTIAVGAEGRNSGGKTDAGAVYVFTRSGGSWSEKAKLTASDKDWGDQFGWSVALEGDTIAVGAHWEGGSLSVGKSYNGAVYVFTRSGGSWSEQAKLTASDRNSWDLFGHSVAIDGDTIAVGAHYEGAEIFKPSSGLGAVYVFTRSGGSWSEKAKLTASDKASYDNFGYSVAVEGDTLAVGAYHESSGGKSENGAVYVFTRSGGLNGAWNQQAKLTASDKETGDFLGGSVAIDGDTIAVGASGEDSGGKTSNGAVYLFKK